MSSTLLTSPPDIWAGKSRNAKAQARHRAKRKAYIEQLEQTVSKLQTALALSAEDVVNLPTTQMKLRELKEENDSLRAELRKFQLQQATNYSISSSIMPMPSAEPPARHMKRRRLSSDDSEHRYPYLDSVGHSGMEHAPTPPIPASGRPMPLSSTSFQNRGYQLQGPGGSTETSQPMPLREEPFAWTSYVQPPSSSESTPWSYSGGHTRNRSSSSSVSSASSDAAPTPYMISSQSHVQLLSPLLPSEDSPMVDVPPSAQAKLIRRYETDGMTNEIVPLYAANISGNSGSAQRTQQLDINTLDISSSGSWSDVQVWPYSTVRDF